MPLVKRSIEPHYVSRVVVAPGVRNDLEFVCNATLGHIIKQMSSLSKHAEDLFNDLHQEMGYVFIRNSRLNEQIHRLKQKIQQLNPVKETVSLQDMNMRKPFKSSFAKEQQILTLNSRPHAITDSYSKSEPPPCLYKLDAYRDDGKDSLKFYTNPGYFLELWCHEMVKNADSQLKKQKHRNKRARPVKEAKAIRAPKSHLDDFKDRRHGPEFVGLSIGKEQVVGGNVPVPGQTLNRPSSLEVSTPTPAEQWGIVGHGFPVADYGLVFDGSLQRPGSLTDAGLGPASQNTLPNYNAKPVELYPVGQTGDTVDSPTNKRTPSKQTRRPGNYIAEDRYVSNNDRVQSGRDAASPRPNMPPPAPPPGSTEQRRGNVQVVRSTSTANRNNLPPPPPAPVQQVMRSESSASRFGRQNYSPTSSSNQVPPAPVTVSPKGQLNNSFDLPPPPTPPPPISSEMIPSPPPMPSPPGGDVSYPPPPPAMLPPLDPYVRADVKLVADWENNNDVGTVDSASLASDTSSATVSSKVEEKPAVRDTRSDLLSAIRTGIQLRKVEERRLKTEQKQNSSSKGFDVQAIMEAAFELRRRALEENDSDRDEDDDAWSDDG